MNSAIQTVLAHTEPLSHPRGGRLPLYVWALNGVGMEDAREIEEALRELDRRGIALFATWDHRKREASIAEGLRIARIQQRLGLRVSVNANDLLHRFYNGDPSTAHIAEDGSPFFDRSFGKNVAIGCPFSVRHRFDEIRDRVADFASVYREAGLTIDVVFADWEIDGPMEWNDAWAHARRCRRCREHIGEIEDFGAFQKVYREVRAEMQRETYADVLKGFFPDILVGNYAEYPHGGERFWYDYFEYLAEGVPFRLDGRAKVRPWAQTFEQTGYTFAMPVVYTWYPTFGWYDFENSDYRWFYNLLKVGSNAAAHKRVPLGTFVHWHTTSPPKEPDPAVEQFSVELYQELLWHLLLRGHETLFLWCPRDELGEEVALVHPVYAEAQSYADFLNRGTPVTFDVPTVEGPVVSGVKLGDWLLVRRTDFTDGDDPVILEVDGRAVLVPRADGCQMFSLF